MFFSLVAVKIAFVASFDGFHSVVRAESLQNSGSNSESFMGLIEFFCDVFGHFEHVLGLFELLEVGLDFGGVDEHLGEGEGLLSVDSGLIKKDFPVISRASSWKALATSYSALMWWAMASLFKRLARSGLGCPRYPFRLQSIPFSRYLMAYGTFFSSRHSAAILR